MKKPFSEMGQMHYIIVLKIILFKKKWSSETTLKKRGVSEKPDE
jgi:hypothetical protein